MKRRILSVLLVAVLAVCLFGGCKNASNSGDPATNSTENITSTTPTTTTTISTVITTTAGEDNNAALYNRLTGEYDNAAGSHSRPVAIMVANDKGYARPQVGLSEADLFIEAETEGGYPRIMAVFADASRVPAQVAPVRSARTHFVKMAQSLDAIYVHAGGSTGADALHSELESNGKINRLNALGNNGNAFWRDAALRASRDYEHSLSTGGNGIAERIAYRGFRTTSDNAPFTFGDKAEGGVCNKITVKLSGAETFSFAYNPETYRYTKYLSNGNPHADTDGHAIEVTNVLVMYDTRYNESAQHISFELQSGNALLCSGGTVRNIQWTRTESGLSFTENGGAATLLPGKTYICLVSNGYKDATIIE